MIFDYPNVLKVDKESALYERIFYSYNGAKVGFRKPSEPDSEDGDLWCEGFSDDVHDWCEENLDSGLFNLPHAEEDPEVIIVFLSATDMMKFKLMWWS